MADKTARLSIDGVAKPIDLPVLQGTRRPRRHRHRPTLGCGTVHLRSGVRFDRVMRIRHHLHRRRRRCSAVSRLSDRTTGRALRPSRSVLSAAERRTAERSAEGRLRPHDHAATRWCTNNCSDLFSGFRRDAHPMAIMCGVTGALAAFYHDSLDIDNPEHRKITAHRLIAKMPTLAAMSYKYSIGQPFMYPRNDLGYAANFLHMMFGNPCEEYEVNPGHREGDGPHLPAARRPRAERIDVDRAPGWIDRRESVRVHRRRHRRAVGTRARRRQRSGAQPAARNRRRRRTSTSSSNARKTRTIRSA